MRANRTSERSGECVREGRARVREWGAPLSGRIRSVARSSPPLRAPASPLTHFLSVFPLLHLKASEQRQRPITMPLQPSEEAVYGTAAAN